VTAMLDRDPDGVILAEHDGQLIGSIIAGWDGWRGAATSTGSQCALPREGRASAPRS